MLRLLDRGLWLSANPVTRGCFALAGPLFRLPVFPFFFVSGVALKRGTWVCV